MNFRKISLFIALAFCLFLVGCSNNEEQNVQKTQETPKQETAVDEETQDDQNTHENPVVKEKTPIDKLCAYIIGNGTYEAETNRYIYSFNMSDDGDLIVQLACDQNNDLQFYLLHKFEQPYELAEDSTTVETYSRLVTLDYSNNSSTLPIALLELRKTPYLNAYFTGNEYYISAEGSISPVKTTQNNVVIDSLSIEGHNYEYHSQSEIKAYVEGHLALSAELLITSLEIIFSSEVGISISDLGFINW